MPDTSTPQDGPPPRTRKPRRDYRTRPQRTPIEGSTFVPRLGPSIDEPFAGLDDPDDDLSPRQRPSSSTTLDELTFVALDCETTGQSPHCLIELGAVAFTLNDRLMSFETLVHSPRPINFYAQRLHGISVATLGGAPPPHLVIPRFTRFIRGAVLVEHSPDAFDTRLIAGMMDEPLDADSIDTSRLARKLWGLRDTIGLERLCERLEVHHRRPHHALADAEATADCFLRLIQLGRNEHGWNTLHDLLKDGRPQHPRTTEPRDGSTT